jgi:hypothetical protein
MRDVLTAAALPLLPEIEKFDHLRPDGWSPLSFSFVHSRDTPLYIGEEAARSGFTDRHEMRFRRAFEECGKYRRRD